MGLQSEHIRLVDLALGELGVREADGVALRHVDVVEALEPRVAIDEVEALAALRAEVRDDEVDAVVVSADHGVELRASDMGQRSVSLTRGITKENSVRSEARSGHWGRTRSRPIE